MIDLKKMKQLRQDKGITQLQVSEALGFGTQQAYFYKESGQRAITANELEVIATVLGVPVGELYTADEDADDPAATEVAADVTPADSPL